MVVLSRAGMEKRRIGTLRDVIMSCLVSWRESDKLSCRNSGCVCRDRWSLLLRHWLAILENVHTADGFGHCVRTQPWVFRATTLLPTPHHLRSIVPLGSSFFFFLSLFAVSSHPGATELSPLFLQAGLLACLG